MKTKNIKSKFITGAVVASMIMATSTAVFASDSTNTANNTSVTQHQGRNNGVQAKLSSLVEAGTLSADKATAIKEALKPQGMNKGEKTDKVRNSEDHTNMIKTKLDALVTAGTITADEQTALETALTDKTGNFKTVFDDLVAAGTLSSDRATAIKEALKPQGMNKGEKTNKVRNSENHTNMIKSKLDALVTAGTITADEETLVLESLTSSK